EGKMNWTEVSIYTTTNGIEIINGGLLKLNINDAVIEDAGVYDEFLNYETLNWDYFDEDLKRMKDIESCIKVYLADNNQGRELLNKIYEFIEELKKDNMNIDLGNLRVETRIINDE
ncbi:MAG TPA: 50S ribosomal protein L11 methyltransferase, partial [Clostridiales bacterium]|nr:50S ribosomal protein L11 methyltransferase [Clostridiales bacterium]